MRRGSIRAGLVAAMLGASIFSPLAPSASAGGGCHAGMTQGEGDRVDMVKACFSPSILRVDPGTEVTFTNKDPIVHNVSAYEWGYLDDMHQGDSFSATFYEEGIYPFACNYHPTMTGAVVVGDGTGPGSGARITLASSEERGGRVQTAPSDTSPPVVAWAGGGLIGLVIGGAGGLFLLRRRRTA